MNGIFLRKKRKGWLLLLFLCGLCFIGLYLFFCFADPQATNEILVFLIFGVTTILIVIPSWLLNRGAYIRVDENTFEAKYHWFGKLRCPLSDIAFTQSRLNTLVVQLKSGKIYTIMGVENAWPLCCYIRRNTVFDMTDSPEELEQQLARVKAAKQKGLLIVCAGCAYMVLNILATVLLTGERELYEFCTADWITFGIMGVIELAIVVATFCAAKKTGKYTVPIERLQYELRRRTLETHPVSPGHVVKVFTDDDYTIRVTVFWNESAQAAYYTMQEFASDHTLFTSYESRLYEDGDPLPEVLDSLLDVTDIVWH